LRAINLEKLILCGMAYAFGIHLSRIDSSTEGLQSLAVIWSESALANHGSYKNHQDFED